MLGAIEFEMHCILEKCEKSQKNTLEKGYENNLASINFHTLGAIYVCVKNV